MLRTVVIFSLIMFLLAPFSGECAGADNVVVSAEEYQQARQVWLWNHKELGRAVVSASVAAAGLARLVVGNPTCAQLEQANTSAVRTALYRSRVAIDTLKKLLGFEQRMGNMDEVRRLEVVMRIYQENASNMYESLKLVLLKRAEECGGGQEARIEAPGWVPRSLIM